MHGVEDTAEPSVTIRETHTGLVVLVGSQAYKVKKPVVTDFLDFSSVALRERACAHEVLLNSRLAPDAYIGVAHFSEPNGGATEPVIVMRRYPDSRRLTTLVQQGTDVKAELRRIARLLASFHARALRARTVDSQADPEAIRARWKQNLAELGRFAGPVVDRDVIERIDDAAARYLDGRSPLFAERISAGRIIDGHGDLLTDDIFCMPTAPILLDCLEFDDCLRYVDGIDDASFLAMDLEFLGRKDLAEFFLDTYCHLAGDPAPQSLKYFYTAYRALVRAKVDCMRYSQGRNESAIDASRHTEMALTHLAVGAIRLALVGGAPGTGKSTLSRALAEKVGAEVISTDDVRRQLQKSGTIRGAAGVVDSGLYEADNVAAVYREIIGRSCRLLEYGRSVILDATWRNACERRLARGVAYRTSSGLIEIVCQTPTSTAIERVRSRAPSTSDATPEVADAVRHRYDAWDRVHPIDTSRPIPYSVAQAEKLWKTAP